MIIATNYSQSEKDCPENLAISHFEKEIVLRLQPNDKQLKTIYNGQRQRWAAFFLLWFNDKKHLHKGLTGMIIGFS
jgi:hypothetical protein